MSDNYKKNERITIWGIVQGVGFRPFVARLASKMGINGSVKNTGGFVRLKVCGTPQEINSFVERIQKEKPETSEIVKIEREEIPYSPMNGFHIEESEKEDDDIGMIPADIAICDDCLKEFHNREDQRYKHPYISCAMCGPRYSVIESLPYDRVNTTMKVYPMCDSCETQYNDKSARRYHAQTISCHNCGPMPEYHTKDGSVIIVNAHDDNREKAVETAIRDIKEGKIIALKGTGGYYFACSPMNEKSVKELRKLKIREEKPFAVLFKDIDSIRDYCAVSSDEEKLLISGRRPIVLLGDGSSGDGSYISSADGSSIDGHGSKMETKKEILSGEVCRSSRYIGAFLPGFGLQYQLLEQTGPLIMTSANLSDLPIIYEDDEILRLMETMPGLAGVLLNKREIKVSLDDSVVRVIDGNSQMIRRSKGYVPEPIYIATPDNHQQWQQQQRHRHRQLNKTHQMLATGGHLKSTFALSKGNFSFCSQYLGDLDSIESQTVYEKNLDRMKKFFGIDPDLIISDMHPLYYTTKFAETYAKENDKKELLKVQHHHAHTASVMAEHGLTGPLIGVSFDGTGYGSDGCIWGGEFLICHKGEYERYSHLKYVDMIGGDSSMKEGWKSAVSHRMAYTETATKSTPEGVNKKVTKREEPALDIGDIIDYSIRHNTLAGFQEVSTAEAAIRNQINTFKTSSMGRLFDAVASLLGIAHINRYEGECAISLENSAYYASKEPGQNEAWDLALKFHGNVAGMILTECRKIREERNIDEVALSGGVFQNKVLMEQTLELLRKENFNVYYNIVVPANDGGIALGQNMIGMYHMLSETRKDI